jgi:exopolysaccharide biosynthesis polyprenyl glycosylphosphotransferase
MDSLATWVATDSSSASGRVPFKSRHLLLGADALSACIGLFAGIAILIARGQLAADNGVISLLMGAFIAILSFGLMVKAGQYTNSRRMSRLTDAVDLTRVVVIAAALITLIEYVTKGFFTGASPSRLVVLSMVAVFWALSLLSRMLLGYYQRRQFARGHTLQRVLLLGSGKAAKEFAQFLEERPWLGVGQLGHVTFAGETVAEGNGGLSAEPLASLTNDLDGLRELSRTMRLSGAGRVVVALDAEDRALVPQVTEMLSLANIPFAIVPTLFEQTFRAAELQGFAELPVVNVEVDPLDRVARMFKRMLDISAATLIAVIGSPIWLLVMLAIVIEDGWPIIYKQERVGKNGRHFLLYKFRTMVKNAEQLLEQLKEQNEAGSDQLFKMRHDPRITKVGRILRKLSIDEVPQIVNVFKGEMSLVGPRPPLPSEVDTYEQHHYYRLRGLPGITGLWQVSGRSDLGFDDMVRLDRYYLDNWSPLLDIQIMLKTAYVVLARKGAY